MSAFRQLSLSEAYPNYKDLYEKTKHSYTSFGGMDFFNLKLFKGDFLLLKNRFKLTPYGLFEKKSPRILLTHYQAISPELGTPNSLGCILVANDITSAETEEFCRELRGALSSVAGEVLFPLNGHFNLGFSVPAEDHDPNAITFLTSAGSVNVRKLINSLARQKKRVFHSLSTNIVKDQASLQKISESIKTRPPGFTVEKLSVFNYRKDVEDYNRIINGSFKDHYAFYPLSFLEEWDLMKTALLVINRNYFRFLSFKGERVAVSMFFPDYNTVLKNGEDALNTLRIFKHKSHISRVRGVNVAVLPEYRGQGLIKYVRNENLLKMIADGVSVIESSYIDQDNVNSIENVKSTGARASHTFDLYSL